MADNLYLCEVRAADGTIMAVWQRWASGWDFAIVDAQHAVTREWPNMSWTIDVRAATGTEARLVRNGAPVSFRQVVMTREEYADAHSDFTSDCPERPGILRLTLRGTCLFPVRWS